YFPEIVTAVANVAATQFVLDGELVVPVNGRLDFDQLLQRIHPAESRIRKLSTEYPALLIAFDLLADARGKSLLQMPFTQRRRMLEQFARSNILKDGLIRLSPSTPQLSVAKRWFRATGGNLDGVIAKMRDRPYRVGERDAMVKVKRIRSA